MFLFAHCPYIRCFCAAAGGSPEQIITAGMIKDLIMRTSRPLSMKSNCETVKISDVTSSVFGCISDKITQLSESLDPDDRHTISCTLQSRSHPEETETTSGYRLHLSDEHVGGSWRRKQEKQITEVQTVSPQNKLKRCFGPNRITLLK